MAKMFYKQIDDYDFTENKAKTGKTLADVAHFTAMIWAGSGTEADKKAAVNFSAFAIQNGCVAARFCAETNKPNDPATTAAYKTHVKPRCINDDKVNTCYSESQLKSINKQRLLRAETDPLQGDSAGDKAIAKGITDIFSNSASAPTDEATFKEKLKAQKDINSTFKNC